MPDRLLPSIGAIAALTAMPLMAHHSIQATYNDDTLVTLAGTITSVSWRNPHTQFVLEAVDAAGAPAAWTVEIGAPNALILAGFSRDLLNAGDRVTLEIWAARDGTPRAHARSITFSDGRRIDVPEDRWMQAALPTAP
jgi:hypothetical protein